MVSYRDRPPAPGSGRLAALLGTIALMGLIVCAIAIGMVYLGLALGAEAKGGDDARDRDAAAALALAAAADPDRCRCATARVATFRDAAAKAGPADLPVVEFVGCEPRCCGPAVPVVSPPMESGARHVLVWEPRGPGQWVVGEKLPATATAAEVKAAVGRVKARVAQQKK